MNKEQETKAKVEKILSQGLIVLQHKNGVLRHPSEGMSNWVIELTEERLNFLEKYGLSQKMYFRNLDDAIESWHYWVDCGEEGNFIAIKTLNK